VCDCHLQVKLVKYISKQLEWKQSVPESERPLVLDSYPHLTDWLHTINLRTELIEVAICVFVLNQGGNPLTRSWLDLFLKPL